MIKSDGNDDGGNTVWHTSRLRTYDLPILFAYVLPDKIFLFYSQETHLTKWRWPCERIREDYTTHERCDIFEKLKGGRIGPTGGRRETCLTCID